MKEKKEINIKVGNRIQSARVAAGLTQDKFSELIGMGTKSVSAVERGTVGVSLSTLQKICQVLSISSDELLFDQRPENDVTALLQRMERLTQKQFEIVSSVMGKLMEAFYLTDK